MSNVLSLKATVFVCICVTSFVLDNHMTFAKINLDNLVEQ